MTNFKIIVLLILILTKFTRESTTKIINSNAKREDDKQKFKDDLRNRYKINGTLGTLDQAYYEALYDLYEYELTVEHEKNAEKNALTAFHDTFIGEVSKYLNFNLFYYLIGLYFFLLLSLVLVRPIFLYIRTYKRKKLVKSYILRNKLKKPASKELIEYYEFCAELNSRMFKPVPKFRVYKDWMKSYKDNELKYLTLKNEKKHKIYDY